MADGDPVKVPMRKQPITVGETLHKAGRPGIVWTVESFSRGLSFAHAVLTRADDPTTKITIAAETLADPLYFRRPVAARLPAGGLPHKGPCR